MTRRQVFDLGRICDDLGLPVLAYGLRTDFRGEPFEGSKYLLAWADNLKEIKAICHCGKKATMVVRLDDAGMTIRSGEQVEIYATDHILVKFTTDAVRNSKLDISMNKSAAAGLEVTVPVELLGETGEVITSEDLVITLPPEGEATSCLVQFQSEEIVSGFQYTGNGSTSD